MISPIYWKNWKRFTDENYRIIINKTDIFYYLIFVKVDPRPLLNYNCEI